MGKLSGSDLVSSIASAITQMEGTIPPNAQYPNGSLAYQNNNPGNIIYIGPNQNGQSGVVKGAGGFALFPSVASGQDALDNQIQSQINSGQNLTQFFNQYAPGNTTNAAGGVQTPAATQNYINYVAQQTGIDPSVPLTQYQSGTVSPNALPSDPTQLASDSSDDSSLPSTAGVLDLSSITDAISNVDPTVAIAIGAFGLIVVWAIAQR